MKARATRRPLPSRSSVSNVVLQYHALWMERYWRALMCLLWRFHSHCWQWWHWCSWVLDGEEKEAPLWLWRATGASFQPSHVHVCHRNRSLSSILLQKVPVPSSSALYLQPAYLPTNCHYLVQEPTSRHTLPIKVHEDNGRKCWTDKNKANHSARKTIITCTCLVQSDQNLIHVTQLSGHKSFKSLDSYSVASREQQKRMFHTISGTALSEVQTTRSWQSPRYHQCTTCLQGGIGTQSSPTMMISESSTVDTSTR